MEAPDAIPGTMPESEPPKASSKFTGVITEEPESASRQASEKPPESAWIPEDEYRALERLPPQEPPAEVPAPIQITAAPEEDKGFTRGVTAYIVLASGGLAALVLFKKK
jgi:hypothetical protein